MLKNNLYSIDTYDGLVTKQTQQLIWEYLEKQTWHVQWDRVPEIPKKLIRYKPSEGKKWLVTEPTFPSCTSFHRTCFSSDEPGLKKQHPLIWGLWKTINKGLNNEYELTGYPEDMFDEEYPVPPTEDQSLEPGWRCYVNGTYGSTVRGAWGPHRDTPDLDDETSVTILYCVNLEWYPRWGGELVFFPEDPEGTTGDHQQFNNGEHQQSRGYNVGWPDQGRIVSPVPGRVIVYDGRQLHNTKPPTTTLANQPYWKVAFRARRKPVFD
jgi:hypothetical protein